MLHSVNSREFHRIALEKSTVSDENLGAFLQATVGFMARWQSKLPRPQILLLNFILVRTLVVGRLGCIIPVSEFKNGSRDEVEIAPIGLEDRCIRTHLQALCDADLLHVWREVGPENVENSPRLFEIDFKKVVEGIDLAGIKLSVFKAISPGDPLHGHATPPARPCSPLYIDIGTYGSISSNEKNIKRNVLPLASRRGNITERKPMLAVPKRPRLQSTSNRSISEVVSTISSEAKTMRAARAATASTKPAHALDKLELQAVLDSSTSRLFEGKNRLIVTAKEHSVLRKRLKENPPEDFGKFIDYTLANWGSIAAGQRLAQKRHVETHGTVKGTPLPMAPSFRDLAYRYPYFLVVWRNRQAESNYESPAEKAQQENRRLRTALAQAKEEVRSVRLTSRRTRPTPVNIAVPQTQPNAVQSRSIDGGEDLPTWEEQQARMSVRRRQA